MVDIISIAGTEALNEKGITPVIPPPSYAVVHGKDSIQSLGQTRTL
jgi:hypothetical protein